MRYYFLFILVFATILTISIKSWNIDRLEKFPMEERVKITHSMELAKKIRPGDFIISRKEKISIYVIRVDSWGATVQNNVTEQSRTFYFPVWSDIDFYNIIGEVVGPEDTEKYARLTAEFLKQ